MATPKQESTPAVVSSQQPLAPIGGFIFDPAHFPFTLLETLTQIADEMRKFGLEKTGGKDSDDPQKRNAAQYGYFEEAEIASYLVKLLNKHGIGYAAGTPRMHSRSVAGQTRNGVPIYSSIVQSAVVFSHKKSGEWIIVPGVGEANDAGDKGITKAITSAVKYIWMKTFLISDGNDIELDQGQGQAESKNQTRNADIHLCQECKEKIGPAMKDGKVAFTVAQVVARTKDRWGKELCVKCASKRSKASDATTETKSSKPNAKPAEKQADEPSRIQVAGKILDVQWKEYTSKGKDKSKKHLAKITIELDSKKGQKMAIDDFHESHHDRYENASKGDHFVAVVDSKKNGQFTNHNVFALLEIAGELVEDAQGNKIETEPDNDRAADYGGDGMSDHQSFDGDPDPFSSQDDDIPFE